MNQEKLNILTKEVDRNVIDLAGIAEMRWTGKSHFTTFRPVARGCDPKSAKRSTFTHKMGQKWRFCRRVKGGGVRFKKSTFGVQKVHFWGVPPSILATVGPDYIIVSLRFVTLYATAT